MADNSGIPDLTQTTTLLYKARNGETKELHVKQPMEPGSKIWTLADIQILAREVAKVLKEDAL